MERQTHLTRRARFCAAHRYHNPALSDEENRELFGADHGRRGHGHNYVVEVTVGGPVEEETGMIVNLSDLDGILRREVIEKMDHRFINYEVEGFDRLVPTTENLCVHIWDKVQPHLPEGCQLVRVRLYESPELFADYYGERTGR